MDIHYTSNIDQVCDRITKSIADFSLLDNETGIKMVENVVTGIQDRSRLEQMGASVAWAENEYGYKVDKKNKYGTDLTNYRTGQMLSQGSLMGQLSIQAKSIEMRYGTGFPPYSSMNGYLEPSDEEITDVEKSIYAHALGRPFYELDDKIKALTFQVFAGAYGTHLSHS